MSQWSKQRQLELYQQQMGAEAAQRQEKAAIKARGGCVCNVRMVKRKWNGEFEPVTIKAIHERSCKKFRPWMAEF